MSENKIVIYWKMPPKEEKRKIREKKVKNIDYKWIKLLHKRLKSLPKNAT